MPSAPPSHRLRARWASARRSPLLGPVLALVGGTAAAQAVVFAARPLLTRLYTPEAFGEFTLVTTVAALLSAVAHGGYRFAVLLPERDDEAGGLVGLSLAGAAATALLAALVVGSLWAAGWTREAAWLFLPVAVLALDASQTLEMWLTRVDRFKAVSVGRVAQSVTVVAVQVGGGLLGAAAVGLVGGAAAGFAASLAVAAWAVWRGDGQALVRSFRAGAMRSLSRRYARFPAFSAPAALLNLGATRLPVLLLAAFAGEAVVGQFGLAYGTLALPLGLVTGAAGQVFFVRAAVAARDGTLAALTRTTLRGLLAVTVFPSLAVAVAGPSLFVFVFGPAWATAGEFAQLLAPWTLAASVASPLTALFDVLERQRADLGFSAVMASVQAAVLVAAGLTVAPFGIVLAASVAGTALRVGHIGWMLRLASVPPGPVVGDVARAFGLATPLAAVVWAAAAWGGGRWAFAATVVGSVLTLAATARHSTGEPADRPANDPATP